MENEKKTPDRPDERKLAGSPESPDSAAHAGEPTVTQVTSGNAEDWRIGEGGLPRPKAPWLTIEHITVICIVLTLLISSLITVWYQEKSNGDGSLSSPAGSIVNREGIEYVRIKVFYPSPKGLVSEEREVEKSDLKKFVVEAAVNEYFKGPSGDAPSYVPEGTKLISILQGSDGTVYLNISHEFRSRFKGDAYGEFLLLRGLYESVMSNTEDVNGLKVLIEGKEVETIGGHISLKGTLGSVITSTMVKDSGSR